ncbi:MAG: class I SAM-dependent methyltransferase [Pseudomonadota bacterium]|nr:class I SAM-dependent methyltransferase [Pseudomonadota bacterium]
MDASRRWQIWPKAVGHDLEPATQSFKDVLDGLAVFYQDPFIRDVRDTVLAFPGSRICIALNKKQTACKKWLAEELHSACGPNLGGVHVLAGWYGLLGAMLLADRRLDISRLTVIDVDRSCEQVARSLNASHLASGRFHFHCADLYDLDYRSPPPGLETPDLVINTSCEHLDRFGHWFGRLPEGQLMALQSNNYRAIPEHVNCVESLADFRAQAPLSELLYAGELALDKYTRFMLIGRK